MNKTLATFLITLAVLAVTSATIRAQNAWKEYVHADQQMAFSMPTNPVEDAKTVDSALGKLTLHEYVIDWGSSALIVIENEYPSNVLNVSTDKLLAGARNGAIKFLDAKVTSEKKITIDGFPGLEFEYASSAWAGKCRMYAVGTRLYQLNSLSSISVPLFNGTDRFLNSLRLIKH